MPTFDKQELLSNLMDRTDCISSGMAGFHKLSNLEMNRRTGYAQWNLAAIFEQITNLHQIYLNDILAQITTSKDVNESQFETGWLGDWVYGRVVPGPDAAPFKIKINRLRERELNGQEILERFGQQLDTLHDIIRHSATKDLRKIKITYSPSLGALKMRLGDSLRYLVANSERYVFHARQLMTALQQDNENFSLSKPGKKALLTD